MSANILRKDIFEVWRISNSKIRFEAVYTYVLEQFGDVVFPDVIIKCIKRQLGSVCQQIKLKWNKCGRNHERFLIMFSLWLSEPVNFPDIVFKALPSSSSECATTRRGRPSKTFLECSDRTKKRKLKELVETTTPEEISVAAEMKLRKLGKKDSASIVKELTSASPQRGTNVKKARLTFSHKPKIIPADKALALIIDSNLSTHQYNLIRQQSNEYSPNLLPSYNKIKEEKKKCYPAEITVSETSAEIKLQSLIDHTVRRLCNAQEEVLQSLQDLPNEMQIIIKWGCDGSQQTRYKQKLSVGESDENLFSISMCPIQMYYGDNSRIIVWQNPAPSSTRYCRPIKFVFKKESTDLITKEVKNVEDQASLLTPVPVTFGNHVVLIKSVLVLSMIDGKVCSALSAYNSSQTCYLCGATPKVMNKPDIIENKTVDVRALAFGLSPLHSWIRFMECLLHISYRLDLKVWQVRGDENKRKVAERKKNVQEKFRQELGLLIDLPTQEAGNTNDGNTARRFFRNAETSSIITGINLELINRLRIILETINCGYSIKIDAFEKYVVDTRNIYLREYSWYYMPSTVHKVLFHGKDIIASCILPIGQLSEEAQEARNKDNRNFREHFTRKSSRVNTNMDLLHRLLISSDPYLTSLRHKPKSKQNITSPEVLALLSVPSAEDDNETDSD